MRHTLLGIVATAAFVLSLNGCTVGDPPYSYPGQNLNSDAGPGALNEDSGTNPPPTSQDAGTPPPPPTSQDAGTPPPPPPPPPTGQDAGTPPPPPPSPVCGNGIVETGEQCDDGNTVSGDGCSSTCQIEATPSCGATNTLSGNVQPIFTASCTNIGCHGLFAQRGITLSSGSTYGSLVGVSSGCGGKPFVDPGNPGNSYLINVLTGSGLCGGDGRMPKGGALSQADVAAITAWICEGAQNN